MNLKNIRWKQRFENFEKAFNFLNESTQKNNYSPLEASGLIKAFEITFELAWKTLKDYLEMSGVDTKSPREVIKQSFSAKLIEDGHIWIEMLEKRNELSHTYENQEVYRIVGVIKQNYFKAIEQVYTRLKRSIDD